MDETAVDVDGGNTDDSDDGGDEDISILVISFPPCMWSQIYRIFSLYKRKIRNVESQTVSWPGLGGGRHTEQTEITQQKIFCL